MAGIKISALPASTAAALTDTFPIVQSSTTKKETLQLVLDLFIASIPTQQTVEVTTATQAMAVNTSYIANRGGGVIFTLPTISAVGDEISVLWKAGTWTVAQNAGQEIRVGTSITTAGVGGSLASSANGDCIKFKCITANNLFEVFSMVGNITVV